MNRFPQHISKFEPLHLKSSVIVVVELAVVLETLVIETFRKLSPFYDEVKSYEKDFRELLTKQLQWQKDKGKRSNSY